MPQTRISHHFKGGIRTKESLNGQKPQTTPLDNVRRVRMNHMNEENQYRDQTGVRVELGVTSILNELGTV